MCVEIVMMILMMISAKEKRYTTCVGAHKVTKRGTQRKKSLFLCALSHTKPPAISSNFITFLALEETKKKTCEKKKGKKRKGNTVVLHVWVEGVGFKNQK